MKTSSLWGKPPGRFYRYLQRLKSHFPDEDDIRLTVVGCADGKFVLPGARLGLQVRAIDIDEIALFGGRKDGIDVPGLRRRLEVEHLTDCVQITHADFMSLSGEGRAHGVLTSGAIQYSRNLQHDISTMVESVLSHATVRGLTYLDYMLPFEDKYKGRPICPDAAWWRRYFMNRADWHVHYNRVLPPTLDRAHVEYPVDHYHQWGHLLAERLEQN